MVFLVGRSPAGGSCSILLPALLLLSGWGLVLPLHPAVLPCIGQVQSTGGSNEGTVREEAWLG